MGCSGGGELITYKVNLVRDHLTALHIEEKVRGCSSKREPKTKGWIWWDFHPPHVFSYCSLLNLSPFNGDWELKCFFPVFWTAGGGDYLSDLIGGAFERALHLYYKCLWLFHTSEMSLVFTTRCMLNTELWPITHIWWLYLCNACISMHTSDTVSSFLFTHWRIYIESIERWYTWKILTLRLCPNSFFTWIHGNDLRIAKQLHPTLQHTKRWNLLPKPHSKPHLLAIILIRENLYNAFPKNKNQAWEIQFRTLMISLKKKKKTQWIEWIE